MCVLLVTHFIPVSKKLLIPVVELIDSINVSVLSRKVREALVLISKGNARVIQTQPRLGLQRLLCREGIRLR